MHELRVALLVPAELDADPGPLAELDGRLEVLRSAAGLALDLGLPLDALGHAREALKLRPGDGEAADLLRRAEAQVEPKDPDSEESEGQ